MAEATIEYVAGTIHTAAGRREKILHDVIEITESRPVEYLVQRIRDKRKGEILIISYHEDGPKPHLHVVHDCNWTENRRMCQCFNIPTKSRKPNKNNYPKLIDICLLLYYLATGGHQLLEIRTPTYQWSNGMSGEPVLGESDHLTYGTTHGDTGENPLASSDLVLQGDCDGRGKQRCGERIGMDGVPTNSGSCIETQRQNPIGSINNSNLPVPEKRLTHFMLTHICNPIENFVMTPEFLNTDLPKYLDKDCMKRAIKIVQLKLMNVSFDNLVDLYRNYRQNCLWSASSVQDVPNYYETVEKSVSIAIRMLKQNYKTTQNIKQTLTDWHLILEKIHPNQKMNAIEVIGPAGSGKKLLCR